VPHIPPTRFDAPAVSLHDSPADGLRVRAAWPGEVDRRILVPPGVLDLITRDLVAGLAAEVVLLALWDRQGVVMLSSADEGMHLDSAVLARGFVGRALRVGRAAIEAVDPRSDESLGPVATTRHVTHAIGVPVRTPNGQAGALCAGFSELPADGSSAVWVVESYARLAALSLHDPAVLQDLLQAAREDALTGCLNFGHLREELARETTRAARHGHGLSVCFIDLDGFKRVNDRHGHTHGNRVLLEVAAALRTCMRAGDAVGRYGGDEFVAILPETDEAEARVLAARVRDRISAATRLSVTGPVTASIGIAEWSPGWSAEALLGAADRALLAAKADGRAVVAVSELHLETVH
jgi:diguanylate cyclase (GGDEF)-like protein